MYFWELDMFSFEFKACQVFVIFPQMMKLECVACVYELHN